MASDNPQRSSPRFLAQQRRGSVPIRLPTRAAPSLPHVRLRALSNAQVAAATATSRTSTASSRTSAVSTRTSTASTRLTTASTHTPVVSMHPAVRMSAPRGRTTAVRNNVGPRARAAVTGESTAGARSSTRVTTRRTPNNQANADPENQSPRVQLVAGPPLSNSSNIVNRQSLDRRTVYFCPICLVDCMKENKDCFTTICGHVFCEACITRAYRGNNVCPICQRHVCKDSLIRLFL